MENRSTPNALPYWWPNMFSNGALVAPPSRRDPWDQRIPPVITVLRELG